MAFLGWFGPMTGASEATRRFLGRLNRPFGVFEPFLTTAQPFRIGETGSVGEDVFVVRHRGGFDQELAIVERGRLDAGGSGRWELECLVPPFPRRRGPGRGEGGGSTPQVEMAEDLLDGDRLLRIRICF